jgi:hypothetical protein
MVFVPQSNNSGRQHNIHDHRLKPATEFGTSPGNSQRCKTRLHALATENLGKTATSEEADSFGTFLLGIHRNDSTELQAIAAALKSALDRVDA